MLEINEGLVESPESIAEDPHGSGWLIKVKAADVSDLDTAMSAADYKQKVEGQ